MGGLAFTSDGLSTPRMPPNVYYHLLSQVEKVLKEHFRLVGHALEAPAKTSHGDVDVLVAEPVNRQILPGRPTGDFLTELLGAKVWKSMSGGSTYNIAVPWPEEFKDVVTEPICTHTAGDQQNLKAGTQRYIQVDISIMPTPASFHWHMFFHAHGDLWNMLGGVIRRFGLTNSSKGLCVRIAEVEKHNKEQARVLATSDPNTVLDYLGLDRARFWKPFNSWDEILAYVAGCRFHNPAQWKSRHQSEDGAETKQRKGKETNAKSVDRWLKANDRQRANKRPLFGYWIETYLPEHVDDTPGRSAFLTREEVLDDAKQFFGPEFAQKLEDRKKKMVRQIGVDKLWADIRKGLPIEGTEVGYVMKGMKGAVVGMHSKGSSTEEVEGQGDVRKAFEESRFDDVVDYARVNWKAVGERQKKLDQEQSRTKLLDKDQERREEGQGPERGKFRSRRWMNRESASLSGSG